MIIECVIMTRLGMMNPTARNLRLRGRNARIEESDTALPSLSREIVSNFREENVCMLTPTWHVTKQTHLKQLSFSTLATKIHDR